MDPRFVSRSQALETQDGPPVEDDRAVNKARDPERLRLGGRIPRPRQDTRQIPSQFLQILPRSVAGGGPEPHERRPLEKVERRGRNDRLGGPHPDHLLSRKPVLRIDPERVPWSFVPEEFQADFGLIVPRGAYDSHRQIPEAEREEQLRLPVDLLVQVPGTERARRLHRGPRAFCQPGKEGSVSSAPDGNSSALRNDQQERKNR